LVAGKLVKPTEQLERVVLVVAQTVKTLFLLLVVRERVVKDLRVVVTLLQQTLVAVAAAGLVLLVLLELQAHQEQEALALQVQFQALLYFMAVVVELVEQIQGLLLGQVAQAAAGQVVGLMLPELREPLIQAVAVAVEGLALLLKTEVLVAQE
jgi:hypothetical protein